MACFTGNNALLLSITLFFTLIMCVYGDGKTVRIMNDLGGGLFLTVHCKSTNHDLGTKVLSPDPNNNSFEFSFPSAKTQYSCSFEWPGVQHSFDIYVESRDAAKCDQCDWLIASSGPGPCRFNFITKSYDTCFPWNI